MWRVAILQYQLDDLPRALALICLDFGRGRVAVPHGDIDSEKYRGSLTRTCGVQGFLGEVQLADIT